MAVLIIIVMIIITLGFIFRIVYAGFKRNSELSRKQKITIYVLTSIVLFLVITLIFTILIFPNIGHLTLRIGLYSYFFVAVFLCGVFYIGFEDSTPEERVRTCKKQKHMFFGMACLLIAMILTVAMLHSNPLRRSTEDIEEKILRTTPIGMTIDEAIQAIDESAWLPNRYEIRIVYIRQPNQS
ncbi:MAG: hypothetical protein FWF78_07715 [Defluviitaleaceae bacterium]|nr:hypothetical protein [Defluviitaleaceae bacterium]